MNPPTVHLSIRLAAILVLSALGASVSPAAPAKKRPPEDRGRLAQRAGKFLSEEQRARLREHFEGNRERLTDLAIKLQQARREFHRAALAGAEDGELRKQAKAVAELEVERLLLQAKALAKLRGELPPAVRDRLQQRSERRDNTAGPKPGKEAKPKPDKEAKKPDKELKKALKPKNADAAP
jgi:hypothetical protein